MSPSLGYVLVISIVSVLEHGLLRRRLRLPLLVFSGDALAISFELGEQFVDLASGKGDSRLSVENALLPELCGAVGEHAQLVLLGLETEDLVLPSVLILRLLARIVLLLLLLVHLGNVRQTLLSSARSSPICRNK